MENNSAKAVVKDQSVISHKQKEVNETPESSDSELTLAADKGNGAFLASMSHEIRIPMDAIFEMTTLLQETSLTTEQAGFLNVIKESSSSLLAIVNDSLDYLKIEAGCMTLESKPFDFRKCVYSVLNIVAAQAAEKKIELRVIFEDHTPIIVEGDATRFRQVLVDLLSNAVKFTEAGEIIVAVCPVAKAEAGDDSTWIEIELAVEDPGVGIDKKMLKRLFKPFSRIDDSSIRKCGETGLGLAISKQLVNLMGGEIRVESTPGVGSIFIFTVKLKKVI
ncbi:ATP-binding protein [uncultured Desulfobacter sp.]|uniref:sensor histidine kinase n=1 Tax=uncultured Desulfobacter sp. TaxID=240139 RepID=UPI002AAAC27B|nr:ATP-binding protein [uncultured Desulfobacter sp.]